MGAKRLIVIAVLSCTVTLIGASISFPWRPRVDTILLDGIPVSVDIPPARHNALLKAFKAARDRGWTPSGHRFAYAAGPRPARPQAPRNRDREPVVIKVQSIDDDTFEASEGYIEIWDWDDGDDYTFESTFYAERYGDGRFLVFDVSTDVSVPDVPTTNWEEWIDVAAVDPEPDEGEEIYEISFTPAPSVLGGAAVRRVYYEEYIGNGETCCVSNSVMFDLVADCMITDMGESLGDAVMGSLGSAGTSAAVGGASQAGKGWAQVFRVGGAQVGVASLVGGVLWNLFTDSEHRDCRYAALGAQICQSSWYWFYGIPDCSYVYALPEAKPD